MGEHYNHSVIPSKDGKLIEASDQVPSGGDVASYEDAECQDGKGVHRIAWWWWWCATGGACLGKFVVGCACAVLFVDLRIDLSRCCSQDTCVCMCRTSCLSSVDGTKCCGWGYRYLGITRARRAGV